MKKVIIKFFCIFCFFVLVLSLQACFLSDDGIDNQGDKGGDIVQNDNFFSLKNFNYNSGYTSQNQNEKGFLIFDDIDFNSVIFNSSEISDNSVIFTIWHSGKKLQTISKNSNGNFASYRLDKKGEYTIDVNAQKRQDGAAVSGTFKINVIANGRPDSVHFTITNSKGETVENVKGGDEYTFTAKIYSDEKEITVPKESFYWGELANEGIKECKYIIGNTVREEVKPFDFYCFINNNNGQKVNIVDQTFTEVDNLLKTAQFPEGVYYQYGFDTTSKAVELDVNAANTELGDYFYNVITAEYRFDNGQVAVLEKVEKAEEGKFSLYISYDEANYNVYSTRLYDYSVDTSGKKIATYYANGVMYQFDPNKRAVKMHLVVWEKRKNEIGYSFAAVKIDSSELDVKIKVNEVAKISVSSISGASKNDAFPSLDPTKIDVNNKYKYFTKTVIDDTVVLNVCCDMDNNGNNTSEFYGKTLREIKQYFVLNVNTDSDNLWDYTIDYSYQGTKIPIQHIKYENSALGIFDRYFVCPNVGVAQINVRSRFSDKVITLTVNVIDKVFDEARAIQYDSDYKYNVFANIDMRLFIKIKEIRLSSYSKDDFYLRDVRDNEELEYLKKDKTEATAPDKFSSDDNGINGQDIVVRIRNTTIKYSIPRVYIIPNFEFKINDTIFSTADIDGRLIFVSTQKPTHTKDTNPKDKYFQGFIPVMDYEAAQDEVINYNSLEFVGVGDEKIISCYGVEYERYSYGWSNNIFHIYYFFSYGTGALNNLYRVEIAKITVK